MYYDHIVRCNNIVIWRVYTYIYIYIMWRRYARFVIEVGEINNRLTLNGEAVAEKINNQSSSRILIRVWCIRTMLYKVWIVATGSLFANWAAIVDAWPRALYIIIIISVYSRANTPRFFVGDTRLRTIVFYPAFFGTRLRTAPTYWILENWS